MLIKEENYVEEAERVIKSIGKPDDRNKGQYLFDLTTSKMRNLLAMASEIFNSVSSEGGSELSEASASKVRYMKVKMIYEAGRDRNVSGFLQAAKLIDMIGEIGRDRKSFLLYCKYFESLIAYFKFYGGRDK